MASSSKTRQSRREALEAQRLAIAQKERRNRILMVAAGVVVLAVVVGVFIWGFNASNSNSGTEMPPNRNSSNNGIYLAPPVDGVPTLEVFSDYNCNVCKGAHLTLHAAMEQLVTEGKLNVLYHTMSSYAASSRPAAIAVACADIQGVFSDYNNQLYIDQSADGSGYNNDQLRTTIPAAIGLSGDGLTAFQTCLDTEATGTFVSNTAAYASTEGVTGTPSFRINGETVSQKLFNQTTGSYDPDLLRQVVAEYS